MTITTHQDIETPTPSECVGPLTISVAVTDALYALAEAAAVDVIVPLSVCASELMHRMSLSGTPPRAHVIHGYCEAVTPVPSKPWDSTVSFRDALRTQLSRHAPREPVDVTILVSPDGGRLYVESTTGPADATQSWAEEFLRLLSRMSSQPDAPLAGSES